MIVGALAGGGWYLWRNQTTRQAVTGAANKVRAAVPVGGSAADRTYKQAAADAAQEREPAEPREARAAAMAAQPAFQAPATPPEPR
jgi:hypothetical protein